MVLLRIVETKRDSAQLRHQTILATGAETSLGIPIIPKCSSNHKIINANKLDSGYLQDGFWDKYALGSGVDKTFRSEGEDEYSSSRTLLNVCRRWSGVRTEQKKQKNQLL